MLFSRTEIANYINDTFEPVWQAVRPVPIVRIDFGGGNLLTRTLHGNIATYACTPQGQTLDILPGIYEPQAYLAQLRQFELLARWSRKRHEDHEAFARDYHRRQAESLARDGDALKIVARLDVGKRFIEERLELVLAGKLALGAANPQPEKLTDAGDSLQTDLSEDVAGWEALAEDTRINELSRRRMIHQHLAERAPPRPADVTKWLYREVLHSDLDDPYLGLGEVLFANYPFRAEDGSPLPTPTAD